MHGTNVKMNKIKFTSLKTSRNLWRSEDDPCQRTYPRHHWWGYTSQIYFIYSVQL